MADGEVEEVTKKEEEEEQEETTDVTRDCKPDTQEIIPQEKDIETTESVDDTATDVDDEKSLLDTEALEDSQDSEAFIEEQKSVNGSDLADSYCANFGMLASSLDGSLGSSQGSLLQSSLLQRSLTVSKGKDTGQRKSSRGKRKLDSSQQFSSSKKSKTDLPASQKLPPHGYPLEHPFNKDGYRYILADQDPVAPKANFDQEYWAGKPIPGDLYRVKLHTEVLLSMNDRAPQLKISEDRLSVTGEKGYCMIRATHGVNRGAWYFEMNVEDMPDDSATRLGWSRLYGNLQAPLGYDRFSFSWRSKKGTRFHESRGKHYSDSGYTVGDVLGFFIYLPDNNRHPSTFLPSTFKDRALIKFKNYLYFEEKDQVDEAIKKLATLSGSKIKFYKNGVCQGVAFEDIFDGEYYPAISIYKNATVKINFGPYFQFPPTDEEFRPMSERAGDIMVEQALADSLYHVEALEKPAQLTDKPLLTKRK
ncbi:set1/Ash2 histone methyltransferase complex subunit ASH2-like [Actinia tenebrosa]|uniref:Set1/Ash2 histone methyltransferase complex subunit ASH2-like n=1 Tax=Actinia tenebrosa TaxID=6105 RepID=A0A6P8HL97_ACTTE|nr:set1/Ash2 histone methyltransferase complex subunit ASH2-like [Actinia tenebrosa]